MRNRLKKWIAPGVSLCLGIAAALGLAGCGDGEDRPDEREYVRRTAVLATEALGFADVQMVGDTIYVGEYTQDREEGAVQHIYTLSREGEAVEVMALSLDVENGIARSRVLEDGKVCVALYRLTETGFAPYSLQAYDGQGQALWEQSLESVPELRGVNSYSYGLETDEEGRLYLLAGNGIYLFDSQGGFGGQASLESGAPALNLVQGGDGSVYTVYSPGPDSRILARVDFQKAKAVDVGSGFPDCSSGVVFAAGEDGFWCSTDDSLWWYDLKQKEGTQVFSWLDQNLKGAQVRAVLQSEEELLICTSNAYAAVSQLVTLGPLTEEERIAREQQEGPIEITVAGSYLPFGMEDAALSFNMSQSQYRVRLVNYQSGEADTIERIQRAALLDTDGYDLLCLVNLNVEALVKQGVLEDLNPYLDNSQVLHREDMFENILAAFEQDGILVGIPKDFDLFCLAGKTEYLGDRTEWTMQEFLDFGKEHPDQWLVASGVDNLRYYTSRGDLFLKEENGRLVFDEQECRDYLELLKSATTYSQAAEEAGSRNWLLQRGEALLDIVLLSFDTPIEETAIFGTDQVTYIGMPSQSGGENPLMASYVMSICSQSDCKEGAWAFLEYCMTDDSRQPMGFPIIREQFEVMADQWLHPDPSERRKKGEGTWIFEYAPAELVDVQHVEIVREVIERGGYWVQSTEASTTLARIISEELSAYLEDQKDIEAVLDIIGSRWLIYNQERQ